MSEGGNAYEAARALRIARNRARMMELGLVQAAQALSGPACWPPLRQHRRGGKPVKAVQVGPARTSKRLQGEQALPATLAAELARAEVEAAPSPGTAFRGTSRRLITLPLNTTYAAPFTLRSLGITVLELGEVHRGPWAENYWSSGGCLHHHAYPVGYRATKKDFGTTFEMRIDAGPTGPAFTVTDLTTGAAFYGESPTKPWTDVCKARRTGRRISGPQFFGFSDVTTQRAIASCLYNERELAAALAGERVPAEQPFPADG